MGKGVVVGRGTNAIEGEVVGVGAGKVKLLSVELEGLAVNLDEALVAVALGGGLGQEAEGEEVQCRETHVVDFQC